MAMLKRMSAAAPAKDYERAKSWYADKLGLKPVEELEGMGAYYEVGGGRLLVYPSEFAGTNQATAFGFEVDDIEATVKQLRADGVEFQEYDFPEMKTVDGVATYEQGGRTIKSAWCKDSEGNIIAFGQKDLS